MPDTPQPIPLRPKPSDGDTQTASSPKDMSQYIRTYAKDVAKLTNQPQAVSSKTASVSASASLFKRKDDADGVALPEVDESPMNRPDGVSKDFSQETLELSEEDSAGIFAKRPPARVTMSAPASPLAPSPSMPPGIPEPSAIPTPPAGPELDPVRQAVLARLRERAATSSESVPLPVPPPPIPAPRPVRPPEPITPPVPPTPSRTYTPPPKPPSPPMTPYVPPSIPVPPPAEVSAPAPRPAFASTPPPTPPPPIIPARTYTPTPPVPPPGVVPLAKNQEAVSPSPLHTYTSDFSERIDRERASTFTVLAAQQDQGTRIVAPKKKRSVLPVVLATFLIVLGAGGLFAAYQFIGSQNQGPETLGVPSLILADEKMELAGPDYRQELADAATQPLVEGNILVTYVTAASTTPLGLADAPQPGGALIRLLNLGAPDILLRNVDLSSTVGVVSSGGGTHPFFILRVNSFERTFAGMLGWENTMLKDLEPLYPTYIDLPSPAPATTGTSTASAVATPPPPIAPQGFVDDVVANRDVRALRDGLGRTLLIYGYSDKQTLIIARDEAAFTTLVARLTATRNE